MIYGVKTKVLKVIPDERGRLMEILRADDEVFERFGQVYMTTNYPQVVKAWHFHERQSDNVACIYGMIKLALYDDRKDSTTYKETNEFVIGPHNPMLVHIPPMILHGWKCISETESIVINISDREFRPNNPDEQRRPWDDKDIGYDWSRKFF